MYKKALVAYFSASGITKKVAQDLAGVAYADVFEIRPQQPYTEADLDWTDKSSRSTVEMNDALSRPAIVEKKDDMEDYDVVFLGFPIWWYTAPRIVNTFLESYDFSGKTIVIFATSGSSGLGDTVNDLRKSCSDSTKLISGKVLTGDPSDEELAAWVESLEL